MNPGVFRDFLPTLFCQRTKHLIYLSTISFSFSFNSLFPSYSCLYSNISTLNSLTYSSHNLQYSFLLLDSHGPSASRAHSHRSVAEVPSPRFSSLISLRISNSQLPSLQVLPALLFALCKEIHISFLPVCTSNTGWGLGCCRDKSSVSCNVFERTSGIFSQFSHTQTLLYVQQARLSSLFDFLHLAIQSLELISSAFNILLEHEIPVRKRLLQKNFRKFNSKATSSVCISQSQKSFRIFAHGLLSTKGYKTIVPHLQNDY